MTVGRNEPAPVRDQHQTTSTAPSASVTVAVIVMSSPSTGARGACWTDVMAGGWFEVPVVPS
jgi:hypothetical protein